MSRSPQHATLLPSDTRSAATLGFLLLGLYGCLPAAPSGPAAADLAAPAVADLAQPDMAQGTIVDVARLTAREIFDTLVIPTVTPSCAACHNRDSGVGPGFLRSASTTKYEPYPITVAWTGFVVDDPQLSQLLRKGQHEGPPLNLDQADIVLKWLQQEKAERDASTVIPFKPQVKPFTPVLSAARATAPYNTVDLGQINRAFAGAYLRFTAVPISSRGALEISDLRFFNLKPGAMANEQRTIHMVRPLFVVWTNNKALPDPVDNFNSTDRTVALNQHDTIPGDGGMVPGSNGTLIVPGLFTLNAWRPGSALSVVFDELSLVAPQSGGNPCTAAGLTQFTTKVAPFITPTTSCVTAGCHDANTQVAGINMALLLPPQGDVKKLCEQLKFYNGLTIIDDNTNPAKSGNHMYRWTDTACRNANLAAGCFTSFANELKTWRTLEGQ